MLIVDYTHVRRDRTIHAIRDHSARRRAGRDRRPRRLLEPGMQPAHRLLVFARGGLLLVEGSEIRREARRAFTGRRVTPAYVSVGDQGGVLAPLDIRVEHLIDQASDRPRADDRAGPSRWGA